MLVYATGGMRWPLIQLLRPLAAQIGQQRMEQAVERSGIAANKRRTFLDDLLVPKLDFFHWERLRTMLESRGFGQIERWGPEARLDHEHSLTAYREDLQVLVDLLAAGADPSFGDDAPLFAKAESLARNDGRIDRLVRSGSDGRPDERDGGDGQGHRPGPSQAVRDQGGLTARVRHFGHRRDELAAAPARRDGRCDRLSRPERPGALYLAGRPVRARP